jgi:hypothetical protein
MTSDEKSIKSQALGMNRVEGESSRIPLKPKHGLNGAPSLGCRYTATTWALVFYLLFDGFHFWVLQGAGDGEGVGGRAAFHVYFAIEGDRAR